MSLIPITCFLSDFGASLELYFSITLTCSTYFLCEISRHLSFDEIIVFKLYLKAIFHYYSMTLPWKRITILISRKMCLDFVHYLNVQKVQTGKNHHELARD